MSTIDTAKVEAGLHVMVRFVLEGQVRAPNYHSSHTSSRSELSIRINLQRTLARER
jgi:hypothetical protein